MTADLLASPVTRRKAVLDTCTVFEGKDWRDRFQGRVRDWLGADGISVLPARVIAEIAHVATKSLLSGASGAKRLEVQRRAALALKDPEALIGIGEVRRAVLRPTDVAQLCRDSADRGLVTQELYTDYNTKKERWVTVPGDADFEIAHTVRVLTGADHQAVLVTADRDLKKASGRLGVALLGAPVPPPRTPSPAAGAPRAGAPLPRPGTGTLHLLGLEVAVQLLKGDLPRLGGRGDTVVVLSSTLVRAAQRAALSARDEDGVAAVQERLAGLLDSGSAGEGQLPVAVLPTVWPIYRTVAERVTELRFAREQGDKAWDMHSLLVLATAEVLCGVQHRVRLVDCGSAHRTSRVIAGAKAWQEAGALLGLVGAAEYRVHRGDLVEVELPATRGPDMAELLRQCAPMP
ncbi:hypothetical protein [Blastococcus sp. SYSU DS0617]